MLSSRALSLGALFPVYGLLKSAQEFADASKTEVRPSVEYGAPSRTDQGSETWNKPAPEDRWQKQNSGALMLLFLFLVVFIYFVPAVQAFSCFDATNLYLPGWAWGLLIILFWPLGAVWLVFRGGCSSMEAASSGVRAAIVEGASCSQELPARSFVNFLSATPTPASSTCY